MLDMKLGVAANMIVAHCFLIEEHCPKFGYFTDLAKLSLMYDDLESLATSLMQSYELVYFPDYYSAHGEENMLGTRLV